MPFGARLALCVSNEALRRHKVFAQPELFLEGQKLESGRLLDWAYTIRTTYCTFHKRDRLCVITLIIDRPTGPGSASWRDTSTVGSYVVQIGGHSVFKGQFREQWGGFYGGIGTHSIPHVELTPVE
jgi:hypothetical protein